MTDEELLEHAENSITLSHHKPTIESKNTMLQLSLACSQLVIARNSAYQHHEHKLRGSL